MVHVDQLNPGTTYDVRVAALQEDKDGQKRKTYSPVNHITTKGRCEQNFINSNKIHEFQRSDSLDGGSGLFFF